MNLFDSLAGLVKEPPPDYIFEISEAGVAWSQRQPGGVQPPSFQPFPSTVLQVTPLKDNVLEPEALAATVRALIPQPGPKQKKKVRRAILVLPDFCSRIAVLDFDQFPSDPAEQAALVRFRMKRSVPFDIESAAMSYYAQKPAKNGGKYDVVVVLVSLEILARYEAPFRAASVHPGMVTTSALASLDLIPGGAQSIAVLAKLSGRALTVVVTDGPRVKLLRCVELDYPGEEEILGVIYPTLAYVEDELGSKAQTLYLSGFGAWGDQQGAAWTSELGLTVEPLRSKLGTPGPSNAGLLGVLAGMEA